ncbi:MAG TPA: winged helix-turn-helix domain-containing protein [Nitrospirales bacterium]|nr:winged helix-turn-helix domain-containing protein [Nitrospirales bacterium]
MRDLVLQPQTFRVVFRAQAVFLTRLEFRLLEQLLDSEGRSLYRQDLLDRGWGPQVPVEVLTEDSHIVRLRRKLQRVGDHGPTIETVWGVGYRIRIIDDYSVPS